MTATIVIDPGWTVELHPSSVHMLTMGVPPEAARMAEREAEKA